MVFKSSAFMGAGGQKVWLTTAMFLALFLAFGTYVYSEKQIDRANDLRQLSYQLADQLRQSSDELTRMARTYVVTGNPIYKRHFRDILDIRDGRKPRPEGSLFAYWDLALANPQSPRPENGQAVALLELMRQAGFTDAEFAKLAEAKRNSDSLAVLEGVAMGLAESVGPDAEANRAKARLMLHDGNYHQVKATIMRPIHEFFLMMDQRTLSAVNTAINMALMLRLLFIAGSLGAIFLLWQAYRSLRTTLGGTAEEVHAHMLRIGRGDFSTAIAVRPDMQDSVLQGLAQMQDKLHAHERDLRQAQGELKRLNEKLEERVMQRTAQLTVARDEAEKANRAKSEFLSSMSHELRTPLNAVLGFAELLAIDPELAPDKQESARQIERAGKLLLNLVTEILDLSRIEADRLELAMEPLSVKTLTDKSFRLVAAAAQTAGVELIDGGGDGQGATILADAMRLQQVVLNFLTNAIKYNRPHGSVRLSYVLTDASPPGAVRIVVSDTGRGIPADKQARVFSSFDRLGLENGSIEGTGIGLLITQRIVEAMGGTVGFTSREGEGSTFWAEFPLHADHGAVSPLPASGA